MTVNLWIRQSDLIVVAADSAETVNGHRASVPFAEYRTIRKFRIYDGVCIVTLWGEFIDHSQKVFRYLDTLNINPNAWTVDKVVDKVADKVFDFLQTSFKPHELLADENGQHPVGDAFQSHTGYHVCGFSSSGDPKCYNVFWGTDIPPKSATQPPKYESYPKPYEHQPFINPTDPNPVDYVFTGRNDLARIVIRTFLDELRGRQDTRYDSRTTRGKVQLADLVLRFASEITPQVGPPFHIGVIQPNNSMREIINRTWSPLDISSIGS
jgi:hypothetical protein